MVTPNITKWDATNMEGFPVTNPIDETKKVISQIKDEVDLIVAAMHMGDEKEYDFYGSGADDVMESCPEIDIFIGAHFHMAISDRYFYNSEYYSPDEMGIYRDKNGKDITEEIKANGILFMMSSNWGKGLSVIDVEFKKEDGKWILKDISSDVKMVVKTDESGEMVIESSDEGLSEVLEPYHEKALADANSIIGEMVGGNLVPDYEIKYVTAAKMQPTAMIELINKVQIEYASEMAGMPVDVAAAAVFRGDSNIMEGEIKKSDMALIYKYDNTLYALEITGKQLKKYMEWSVQYYNTFNEGDLTISFDPAVKGYNYDMFYPVVYDVDISQPVGNRIKNLSHPDGTPIEDDEVLILAVNNYRANSHLLKPGGVFKEGDELPRFLAKSEDYAVYGDGRIRDLIRRFLVEKYDGILTPGYFNNWRIIGNNWNVIQREKAVECINKGEIEYNYFEPVKWEDISE